jgi:hypothetical protein
MPLSVWRLIREVFTYEGARIFWTHRNALLDGVAPKDADVEDVKGLLHALAEGVVF